MRSLLSLAALLLAAPLAHAQIVSVYGTFAPVRISNLVNGSTSTGATSTTSVWNSGFGVGATFNVIPLGPIRLGLDIRDSEKLGNNGSDLILAGPRLDVHIPFIKLHPYIQASGGYLRTRTSLVNSPLPSGTQERASFAAYEVLGGLDYPLVPFFDFRVIEIGGGQGYSFSGSSGSGNNISLFTISTGVVFHF